MKFWCEIVYLYRNNAIMNNMKDIQMKIACEDNILGRIDDYSQVQPTKNRPMKNHWNRNIYKSQKEQKRWK